ncbi:helix-turn-helix transcriptional regulator [Salinivibrio costicola]|uniref:AlpA family phage regulatory protein n=2 Tax=Salinivibrio TaxID=51366 RepID=A0ABX6K503_SALCS|nr:AlpA family phage regulatory protein [Salinivibrio costicola]OOF04375.1 transcriptional regulator [Salinivibrio sp. MA440]QIR05255.1 AlpA family phage regulatory protein [Salinivibrio costicola]
MFIRQEQLAKEMGVSVSTLWRWRRDGKMPPVVALSSRVVGWQRKDIEQWLKEQTIDATCHRGNNVLASLS